MLVRFTSTATESVMMFGDVAMQLIRMMGASGAIPGAIDAAGLPAAIQRLRQQLARDATAGNPARATPKEDGDEEQEQEASIALQTRAQPLLDVLERAAAAEVPVMWETA